MRTILVAVASAVLSFSVVGNAYYQKKQFYPSVVYLTKSNMSMAVLYLQALVMVLLFGQIIKKLFFGQLRAAETEHLIERSWYAVTETCLAFTVFRDDFSPKFVGLFTVLLFMKCFHWLGEDRIDFMERSPVITWLFHVRAMALIVVLSAIDLLFIRHAYYTTLIKGPSVQLVFGFEYAILLIMVAMFAAKYVLNTVDMQSENPWENKAVYLLYVELLLGFIRVMLYMAFVLIMIRIHTFPLFAIRPMYISMRAFKKALHDVVMSRRAIRNMNTLYPSVTDEELRATPDPVCIICREEMTAGSVCKRLPCNHVFHASCLRSWFQRQQTCPTCRMDVLRANPARQQPQQQQQAQQQQNAQQQAPTPPVGSQQRPDQQPPQMQPGFQPFPGMFPWIPPMQPPAAAGAAPSGSGNDGAQRPSTSNGAPPGNPNATSHAPPFIPAGFLPPPMFFPPPPFPAVDLSTLSDEQLSRLEFAERQYIEARVQSLRNIHTLLDATMIQMERFLRLSVASPVMTTSAQPRTETNYDDATNSVPDEDAADSSTSSAGAELRRRRLEKFSNAEGNQPASNE